MADMPAEPVKAATTAPAKAQKPYPHPLTPGRSRNMQGNRRTDTKPELALRSALHALGYRYRKDFRIDLPRRRVRPDIAFTRRKVAVFIDGCFWHACPEHGSQPKNNEWYWSPKLRKNVERDKAADDALTEAGWTVVRLWEHVPVADAVAAVVKVIGTPARAPAAGDSGELRGDTSLIPPADTAPGPPPEIAAVATMNSHAGLPPIDAPGPG